jgi:hypothetical protein
MGSSVDEGMPSLLSTESLPDPAFDQLELVTPARLDVKRAAVGIVAGYTASTSVKLEGNSWSPYPKPGGFWFDLEAESELYETRQGNEMVLVRPKQAGLYRVDFETWVYATANSSILVQLLRAPGNFVRGYGIWDVAAGTSTSVRMTRFVRVTGSESFYLAIRQTDPMGSVRVWTGVPDYNEARAYSGLYLTKLE